MKIVDEAPKEGQFICITKDNEGELVAETMRIDDGILLILFASEWCEWGPAEEWGFSQEDKFIIK